MLRDQPGLAEDGTGLIKVPYASGRGSYFGASSPPQRLVYPLSPRRVVIGAFFFFTAIST